MYTPNIHLKISNLGLILKKQNKKLMKSCVKYFENRLFRYFLILKKIKFTNEINSEINFEFQENYEYYYLVFLLVTLWTRKIQ